MKTAVFLLLLCAANSVAGTLSESELKEIRFDQNIGTQISLDLKFRDETGATVKLADYFGHKPVILVPGYYGCPMLCTLVLNGLIGALQDMRISAGDQFEIINFSIDPTETASLAAAKKRAYLRSYGRPGAEAGWKFLTGDETSIQKLADEIGFHYAYDSSIRQYAHPSGFVVLTPDGRISRYFFGVDYSAREIDTALTNASREQTSSPVRQLFLLCFHYSPITGKYGRLIITTVRLCGIATVLWLATIIIRSIARERARES